MATSSKVEALFAHGDAEKSGLSSDDRDERGRGSEVE